MSADRRRVDWGRDHHKHLENMQLDDAHSNWTMVQHGHEDGQQLSAI